MEKNIMEELRQSRADYEELFVKLQLTDNLHEENEILLRKRITDLEADLEILKAENRHLLLFISKEELARQSFKLDCEKLKEVSALLEIKDLNTKEQLQNMENQNKKLAEENDECKEVARKMIEENKRIKIEIGLNYISRDEYERLQSKIINYKEEANQKYKKAFHENKDLKTKLTTELVPKSDFDFLERNFENLQRRVTSDFIEKSELVKVKLELESVHKAKSYLEKDRDIQIKSQAKLEQELNTLRLKVKGKETELALIQAQFKPCNAENSSLQSRVTDLQDDKVSLTMQLEELRSKLNSEIEAKLTVLTKCSALQEELVTARSDYLLINAELAKEKTEGLRVTAERDERRTELDLLHRRCSELEEENRLLREKIQSEKADKVAAKEDFYSLKTHMDELHYTVVHELNENKHFPNTDTAIPTQSFYSPFQKPYSSNLATLSPAVDFQQRLHSQDLHVNNDTPFISVKALPPASPAVCRTPHEQRKTTPTGRLSQSTRTIPFEEDNSKTPSAVPSVNLPRTNRTPQRLRYALLNIQKPAIETIPIKAMSESSPSADTANSSIDSTSVEGTNGDVESKADSGREGTGAREEGRVSRAVRVLQRRQREVELRRQQEELSRSPLRRSLLLAGKGSDEVV